MYDTTANSCIFPHVGFQRFARIALAASVLALGTSAAFAQIPNEHYSENVDSATGQRSKWEFLVTSGDLFPTGVQRDAITRAELTALQISYVVRPELVLTTSIGWARSNNIASASEPKLDIYSYDLGAELRPAHYQVGYGVTLSPFAGVGAGGRSFDSRDSGVDTTNPLVAYASAGGDFSVGRVHVRLEARDSVSDFNGQGEMRNDVTAMLGLRIDGR